MTSRIEANVMRRVRTIHTLRALLGGAGVSFVVLATSLYFIGRQVWVARVFENMPRFADLAAVSRFFFAAFTHTDFIVQALVLLTAAAALWLAREVGRAVVPATRFA